MRLRVLMLSDYLVGILALGKGRSSAGGLRRGVCQFGAVALRRNVRPVIRWIPSEINPADAPSRGVRDPVPWAEILASAV